MSGPILITGGAGSVGRSLVARCRADGHTVRVFDLPVCDFTGLEGEPGIEVVQGDITQMATVTQAVQGVSAVMHLAAILPPASERNRERTLAINVDGTTNIIRAHGSQRQRGSAGLQFLCEYLWRYDLGNPASTGGASPNRPGYLRREQDCQ